MLTKEEMEIFDEDFKHFAVANGISNEEWVELNENKPQKAREIVEIFSDVVLQKVYEKITYIENRSKNACLVFKLEKNKMDLIAISTNSEEINLLTPEGIHDALVHQPSLLSYFRTDKEYHKSREEEIHEMITQGCVNSSESFWILLEKAITT